MQLALSAEKLPNEETDLHERRIDADDRDERNAADHYTPQRAAEVLPPITVSSTVTMADQAGFLLDVQEGNVLRETVFNFVK